MSERTATRIGLAARIASFAILAAAWFFAASLLWRRPRRAPALAGCVGGPARPRRARDTPGAAPRAALVARGGAGARGGGARGHARPATARADAAPAARPAARGGARRLRDPRRRR